VSRGLTIARQVEAWYEQRKENLLKNFLRVQIGALEPDHPGGEVGIGLEGAETVATISIFNTGLITIPALDKASRRDFVLDHRMLAPDEDLAETLDRYVCRIGNIAVSTTLPTSS
jgi:hypothetical protein